MAWPCHGMGTMTITATADCRADDGHLVALPIAGADARAALLPAAGMLAAAVLFVAVRLLVVGDGDISSFVVPGDDFVARSIADRVAVIGGDGYDGQFFYRLALDPFEHATDAYGVRLDSPVRIGRIAYPALAWLVAFGGVTAIVPWALVVVNVAGLGVLGFVGGLLARCSGRHAMWGLLVAGWSGFVFTVARDLAEVVASCAVVAGLLALRQGMAVAAGVALSVAVLARETVVVVVVAVAVVMVLQSFVGPDRSALHVGRARTHLAWMAPAGLFCVWQVMCWWSTGEIPIVVSAGRHVASPELGASLGGDGNGSWMGLSPRLAGLKVAQFAVLVGVAVLVPFAWRRGGTPLHELAGWVMLAVLAMRIFPLVWNDWAGFRAFSEFHVVGSVLLIGSRVDQRALGAVAVLMAPVWLATAAYLTVVL